MSRAIQLGFTALEQGASSHQAEILALVPTAQRIAREAGARGITVGDLREAADVAVGHGRQLSYLGAVMKRAGLVPIHAWRQSTVESTHGRMNRVWVAPEFAR